MGRSSGHRGRIRAVGWASVCLAAAVLAPCGEAAATDFKDWELERLAKGEVVQRSLPDARKDGFYGGTGYAVINAPVEAVWEAILNWGAYPEVYPYSRSATVISKKGDHLLLRMELGVRLISLVYHVDLVADEAKHSISFTLVRNHKSDLASVRGSWHLFPQKDGRTLVAYIVAVKIPPGILALIPAEMHSKIQWGLLYIPGYLKRWIERDQPRPAHLGPSLVQKTLDKMPRREVAQPLAPPASGAPTAGDPPPPPAGDAPPIEK